MPDACSITIAVDDKWAESYKMDTGDTDEEAAERDNIDPNLLSEEVIVNILRSGRPLSEEQFNDILDRWSE